MIVLWIAAAAMVAVALVMILPPMVGGGSRASGPSQVEANVAIHRERLKELESDLAAGDIDDEAYQQARQELERFMLEDVAPDATAVASSPTAPTPFGPAAVAARNWNAASSLGASTAGPTRRFKNSTARRCAPADGTTVGAGAGRDARSGGTLPLPTASKVGARSLACGNVRSLIA